MRKIALVLPMAVALFSIQSCTTDGGSDATKRTSFLDVSGLDSSINPADDFFEYCNGKWIKNTKIPDDQTGWGSFYNVEEDNLAKTKAVLETAAKSNASAGSLEQKIGDFYTSGMDTNTIEKRGLEPIKAEMAKIEALKDSKDYINYIANNEYNRGGSFFSFGIGADDKNSNKNVLSFGQAGIGLPDKDYYFKTDADTKKIKDGYTQYIKILLP
jgi:putative endopeptidase